MSELSNELRVTRRGVLKWAGAAGMMSVGGVLGACAPVPGGGEADENGLILPPGFTSRIIARSGQVVPGTALMFRNFPDGGATFPDPTVPGGWYYTVNHEIPLGEGGVTSIRFAPDGTVTSATSILSGTSQNCAGGRTPWGTWLSCEETEEGWVWECDPTGAAPGAVRPAMGRFKHEAAAVAGDGRIYMTEDAGGGGFYRFTPDSPGDLSGGLLEIATGAAPVGTVVWKEVPDPTAGSVRCRDQLADSIGYSGGEGIDALGDTVYFTTKGDKRVWEYDLVAQTVVIRYQGGDADQLDAVDNLLIDVDSGVLLIAEDEGNMELVAIRPDNSAEALVRIPGQDHSEVTGPAFSPDGQRLYFSSQRAPVPPFGLIVGTTYEVTGPFDEYLGR